MIVAQAFAMVPQARAQQAMAAPLPKLKPLIDFNIPPQPLMLALEAFSSASGVQVLYESSVALRMHSAPLNVRATAEEAAEMLVANTGLIVRHTGRNAITIARPSPYAGSQPPSSVFSTAALRVPNLQIGAPQPDKIALRAYSETIRNEVEAALKRDPNTNDGSYRVGVSLWVNDSRIVEGAEIFQSTGRVSRDIAVTSVLKRLQISRDAPANTPRPVRLVILVRSL